MGRRSDHAPLSGAMEAALLVAAKVPVWDGESPVEPVEFTHTPEHGYKRGPSGSRGCKFELEGGKTCNAARPAALHYLPTVNTTLTGDWAVYQGALKHWLPWVVLAVAASGLPRGLDSVLIEGLCCFPTKNPTGPKGGRDQGNHRGFVEKAIGDALEAGGWIESDTWTRYEFGNMQHRVVRGERWTRFRVFPNALLAEEPRAQGELL